MIKSIFTLSIAALSFIGASAFANPSDQVVAKCGDFSVTLTIMANPNGGTGSESLLANYKDGKGVVLTEADARRTKLLGSNVKGSTLYVGNLNSETDVYVEFAFPGEAQTFTVSWGKRGPSKSCATAVR